MLYRISRSSGGERGLASDIPEWMNTIRPNLSGRVAKVITSWTRCACLLLGRSYMVRDGAHSSTWFSEDVLRYGVVEWEAALVLERTSPLSRPAWAKWTQWICIAH